MKVAPLPAKKANPAGTKIYVSSKVVDALKKMKEHTEQLGEKRSQLKEQLTSLPKKRIIDENILNHSSSEEGEYYPEGGEFDGL